MPDQLFNDSTDTKRFHIGSKSRYTLPLSILTHVGVVVALIVVPLVVTSALPTQSSVLVYAMPALPPPPPAAAPPRTAQPPTERPTASGPPLEAPTAIVPEQPPAPGLAQVGGVEGGLPVGLTGGTNLTTAPPPPPVAHAPAVQTPIHVGGQIKEPRKIRHVTPIYPLFAQTAKVSGVVILEALIGPDGRVRDVKVLKSVPLLDAAAVEAVRQWEFTPTLLNGTPVAVVMTVTVNFTLER